MAAADCGPLLPEWRVVAVSLRRSPRWSAAGCERLLRRFLLLRLGVYRPLVVEARIRLGEDRFVTIRRSIVILWNGESAQIWTAQADSQPG